MSNPAPTETSIYWAPTVADTYSAWHRINPFRLKLFLYVLYAWSIGSPDPAGSGFEHLTNDLQSVRSSGRHRSQHAGRERVI